MAILENKSLVVFFGFHPNFFALSALHRELLSKYFVAPLKYFSLSWSVKGLGEGSEALPASSMADWIDSATDNRECSPFSAK